MAFEDALEAVGSDGNFQKSMCLFTAFAWMIPFMQGVSFTFTLKVNPFTCDYSSRIPNLTIEKSCVHSNNGTEIPCPKFVFNTEKDGFSLRNQFLLVCQREYLGGISRILFVVAMVWSGIIGGIIGDRYGRKSLLVVSTIFMIIGGLLAPFMPQLMFYTMCRILVGLGIPGIYNSVTTFYFETLPTSRRSFYYILTCQGWSFGILFTALFGWLFPDFRHYEIALALFIPIFLAGACILPESPRWLYTRDRKDESLRAINKIARWNRQKPLTSDEYGAFVKMVKPYPNRASNSSEPLIQFRATNKVTKEGEVKQCETLSVLFTHRHILLATVVTWFNVVVLSMCFNGLSLVFGKLAGINKYLSLVIGGCLEIAGRFVVVYLSTKVDRKPLIISLMWMVSFCVAVASLFLLTGYQKNNVCVVAMGVIGRALVAWAGDVLEVVMAEFSPTPIRSLVFGSTNSMGRLGKIISKQFKIFEGWNTSYPHYVVFIFTLLTVVMTAQNLYDVQAASMSLIEPNTFGLIDFSVLKELKTLADNGGTAHLTVVTDSQLRSRSEEEVKHLDLNILLFLPLPSIPRRNRAVVN